MPEQIVSGATAGDSGGVARPKIYLSVFNGGNTSFSFSEAYQLPSTLSVSFYFGGPKVVVAGAGNQAALGTPFTKNTAQLISCVGFDPVAVGRSYVFKPFSNAGANLNFSFADPYTTPYPTYPPYAPFFFGGQLVVAKISAGFSTKVGSPLVQNRLKIALRDDIDGISPALVFGRSRISTPLSADFVFSDAYTPTTAINTPFYFGGQIVVSTTSVSKTRLGVASLKTSVAIYPEGIDSAAPPRATLKFSWQSGGAVNFLFVNQYSPPLGANTSFEFPFVSFEGVARVSASARIQAQAAQFSGTALASASASAFLRPDTKLVGAASASTTVTADLKTFAPIRVTGFTQSEFGSAFIDYEIRTLIVAAISPAEAYGPPTVWYRVREVAPQSILSYQFPFQQYGSATVTFYQRVLFPQGVSVGGIGQPIVKSDIQEILAESFTDFAAGIPAAYLRNSYIRFTNGLREDDYGLPHVYNLVQHISHYTPEADYADITYLSGELVHLKYGEPYVENFNKQISAFGVYRTRFGSAAEVLNKAVVVTAQGDEASLYGNALVAYRIRSLFVDGFDALYPSRWVIAYNRAALVNPLGVDHADVGSPVVIDTTQWVRGQDIYNEMSLYGAPFVSFRVRYVDLNTLSGAAYGGGIEPSDIGSPVFRLATQYITPIAPDGDITLDQMKSPLGGIGVPFVEETFSVLRVRQIFSEDFGFGSVANKTPQIFLTSPDTTLALGEPFVSYRVRTLDLHRQGIAREAAFLIQPPWVLNVGRRTRFISLELPSNGISPPTIVDKHVVYTDYPQGIPRKVIDLFQRGLEPIECTLGGQVCSWSQNAVVSNFNKEINPLGWKETFGTATVSNNGVFPVWAYPSSLYGFGVPSFSTYPPQPRRLVPSSISSYLLLGEPTFSPIYVFCNKEPVGVYQYSSVTNTFSHEIGPGPYMGRPDAVLKNRIIVHTDPYAGGEDPPASFLRHKIELRDRYISVNSISPEYTGYPEVLPYTVYVYAISWNSEIYGNTRVEINPDVPPVNKTVALTGWTSPRFGTTNIENFHRHLLVSGWLSYADRNPEPAVNPNSSAGPFPYVPRGYTEVYFPPRGPKPTGWDSLASGTGMVAYRIRHVTPEGWDSFTLTYSIGTFQQRFKIRHLNFKLTSKGDEMTALGSPAVKNSQSRVYPFQIAPPRCGVSHSLTVH